MQLECWSRFRRKRNLTRRLINPDALFGQSSLTKLGARLKEKSKPVAMPVETLPTSNEALSRAVNIFKKIFLLQ